MKVRAASIAGLLTAGFLAATQLVGAATAPTGGLSLSGYMKGAETVSWSPVANAVGYALLRDGTRVATAGSSLTSTRFSVSAGVHTLAVQPLFATSTTSATSTTTTMTTPPAGWSVAPPAGTITSRSNVNGVGLLVVGGPKAFSDYVIDGTTDSAVLLGPECAGSSFSRFHITRAASVGSGPGYGRHAFYVKAANVSVSDLYATLDPSAKDAGSIFSLRYHGFTATRFDVSGLWFASFFDDDPAQVPGSATFTDGKVTFSSSSAMLVDSQFAWNITLTNVALTGPNDSLLHLDSGSAIPHLTLNDVTVNGKPAAAAMTNLPAGAVTVNTTSHLRRISRAVRARRVGSRQVVLAH